MAVKQTAGRDALGEFAPKFAELNDDILFGQVWNREEQLALRDRSIVTVVALMAQGLTDSSFRYHLESAKKNGVTRTEIAEILTHAAFYAGWPKAWAAFRMAKEVWAEEPAADGKALHESQMVFPVGAPNDAFARYFIGQSYLAPLSTSQAGIFNVTFEPGCRNNWHIHHASQGGGQILVCVAGRGYYQEEALAWRRAGQLVLPPGGRGARREHLQRVAGARDGRGLRPAALNQKQDSPRGRFAYGSCPGGLLSEKQRFFPAGKKRTPSRVSFWCGSLANAVQLQSQSALLVRCIVLVQQTLGSSLVDALHCDLVSALGLGAIAFNGSSLELLDSGLQCGAIGLVTGIASLGHQNTLLSRLDIRQTIHLPDDQFCASLKKHPRRMIF